MKRAVWPPPGGSGGTHGTPAGHTGRHTVGWAPLGHMAGYAAGGFCRVPFPLSRRSPAAHSGHAAGHERMASLRGVRNACGRRVCGFLCPSRSKEELNRAHFIKSACSEDSARTGLSFFQKHAPQFRRETLRSNSCFLKAPYQKTPGSCGLTGQTCGPSPCVGRGIVI